MLYSGIFKFEIQRPTGGSSYKTETGLKKVVVDGEEFNIDEKLTKAAKNEFYVNDRIIELKLMKKKTIF
jgi:hypothetical protein